VGSTSSSRSAVDTSEAGVITIVPGPRSPPFVSTDPVTTRVPSGAAPTDETPLSCGSDSTVDRAPVSSTAATE
jgi:hypothetical protein